MNHRGTETQRRGRISICTNNYSVIHSLPHLSLVLLCASVSLWPSSLFLSSLIFSVSLCKNSYSSSLLSFSVPLCPYGHLPYSCLPSSSPCLFAKFLFFISLSSSSVPLCLCGYLPYSCLLPWPSSLSYTPFSSSLSVAATCIATPTGRQSSSMLKLEAWRGALIPFD